jgi:hypothetical protein
LLEPWSESYESETVNPCLRIPEIKVAGKTNTSAAARRRRQRGESNEAKKLPPLPLAKLVALAACVSALAALFLVAVPDFQSEIVSFPTRFATFALRYTMPICFFSTWSLFCPLSDPKAVRTHIEIERKFAAKQLPRHFSEFPSVELYQGDLAFD